jgi:hypothetical protein
MQVAAWAGYIEVPEMERSKLSAHLRTSNISDGKALWKLDAENFKSMAFKAGVTEERHLQVRWMCLRIHMYSLCVCMFMYVHTCKYIHT